MAESASGTTKTVHAWIKGCVQRVGFRNWTIIEATRRGLDGWVRNRLDGRVEAVFAGPVAEVDSMLAACRRGPLAARVDEVTTSDMATDEGRELIGQGFSARQTE